MTRDKQQHSKHQPLAEFILRRLSDQPVVQRSAGVGNLADEAPSGMHVHAAQWRCDVAVVNLGQHGAVCVVAVGAVEQQRQVEELAHSVDVGAVQPLEVDLDTRLEEQALGEGLEQRNAGCRGVDRRVDLGVWVKPALSQRWQQQCDHVLGAPPTCGRATAGRRS